MNNEMIKLNIYWEQPFKGTEKFPLHGASIQVTNLDGGFLQKINENGIISDLMDNNGNYLGEGELVEGSFYFPKPIDSSFKVKIIASYGTKFEVSTQRDDQRVVYSDTAFTTEPKDPNSDYKLTKKENNEYELVIPVKEANASGEWSVFQSMVDLIRIVEDKNVLNISQTNKNRNVFISETGEPRHNPETGDIQIGRGHCYSWSMIAHEFSHAILTESGAVAKSTVSAEHDGSNQYDYDHPENPGYHNKEVAMQVAFSEGTATWLAASLLTHSGYKYDEPTQKGIDCVQHGIDWPNTYYYDSDTIIEIDGVKDDGRKIGVNLNETIDPNHSNYFGEDAEYAIARLLWNITNKTGGAFERIEPKGEITNKVSISLKTLFDKVLVGKEVKNISEFYEKLFNYHVYRNNVQLSNSNLNEVTLEELEKISELGNLFAEFGIAPNIDQAAQEENKLIWYQHKTGTLPEYDKFKLYFFERYSNKLLYETGNLVIEPKEIGEYSYGYEYSLSNVASPELEDYDGTSIRVLIRAIGERQFETGPYLNHLLIDFKPYDNFTPNGGTSFLEPGLALNIGKLKLSNTKISLQGMGDIEYYLTADPWEEGLFVIAVNTSSRPIFVMHGTRPVKGTKTHEDGSEEEVIIEVPSCKEIEMDWGEE